MGFSVPKLEGKTTCSKEGSRGLLGFCSYYKVFAPWCQCRGTHSTSPKTSSILSLLEQSMRSERVCTLAGALQCWPSQVGRASPAPAKWHQKRNGECGSIQLLYLQTVGLCLVDKTAQDIVRCKKLGRAFHCYHIIDFSLT